MFELRSLIVCIHMTASDETKAFVECTLLSIQYLEVSNMITRLAKKLNAECTKCIQRFRLCSGSRDKASKNLHNYSLEFIESINILNKTSVQYTVHTWMHNFHMCPLISLHMSCKYR